MLDNEDKEVEYTYETNSNGELIAVPKYKKAEPRKNDEIEQKIRITVYYDMSKDKYYISIPDAMMLHFINDESMNNTNSVGYELEPQQLLYLRENTYLAVKDIAELEKIAQNDSSLKNTVAPNSDLANNIDNTSLNSVEQTNINMNDNMSQFANDFDTNYSEDTNHKTR